MRKLLKAYQKRLTNLTSSNKSLLLLTLPAEQFMDLHELDFLDSRPSFETIQQLMAGKTRIPLCDALDSRYDKVNEAAKKLRRVARTAAFIEQERGSQDLYVGYPVVRGKLTDGTPVRCPLLFFPVRLSLENNRWLLHPREGEPPQFNKSLLLAYGYFNHVRITDEFLETDFEGFDKESLAFRTQLYELLKQSPLEINFNPDLFKNQLQPFQTFKKAGFEESQRNGEIKLFPEAVLGIFPQAGSYLMPDYGQMIEENAFDEPEDFFFKTKPPLPDGEGSGVGFCWGAEASLITPLPLDASQEQAVRLIKSGQSLVVQGPPGTGKSQLIANLMADYVARGKRVLLVCQKRVALDVVHSRLQQLGMADFIGLVHDFKQDRKPVYEQLSRQIELLDEYKRLNLSLDAIYLERDFLHESRRIDKLSAELEEFRRALFDSSICGLSVKDLYLTSNPGAPHFSLANEYKHFKFDDLGDFMRRLAAYETYQYLDQPAHPWHNRVSFHNFVHSDQTRIRETIRQIPVTARNVLAQVEKTTHLTLTVSELEIVSFEKAKPRQLLELVQDETQWQVFLRYKAGYNAHADAKWLDKHERGLLECLQGNGVEKASETKELETVLHISGNALRARLNVFSWLRWQWFSGGRKQVRQLADANGLSLRKDDLEVLVAKIENRIALEKTVAELQPVWETGLLHDENAVGQWFANQRVGRKACKLVQETACWQPLLPLFQGRLSDFKRKMEQLLMVAEEWETTKILWKTYLTDGQISQIHQNENSIPEILKTLRDDFDALHELDAIKFDFNPHEKAVIKAVAPPPPKGEPIKTSPSGAGGAVFDNSLRLAWIGHIEDQFPVLRAVSTHKMRQMEDELQDAVQKKQTLSRDILLLKLREQTYRHVEFNRLNNLVTYRDVKHQVTKKRSIWTLRKLLAELGDEVFRLIPCWMASPEAVSAVFNLQVAFDLVIFDEASQCFAERGIPAMYRGRQVVVVGDSKQLQPSDLYQIRYEEETEDVPDLEVDSLLDLAARYLPQTQLRGHYRSQSLELMDFSNRHFYQHNLELLPDFQLINDKEPAIHYLKIDGIWAQNQNLPEAGKVVGLVWQLMAGQPGKSIGIVTFNHKQQNLIQEMLENAAMAQGMVLPPSLFVKNIENVQGDERDTIIFSVGYAPDANGRLAMQFGSLNQQGGENRLNVAVTRAREKIYIISSLHPQQLRTDDATHEGPKLLRQYLEYAWQVSAGGYVPQPKPARGFVSKNLLKDKIIGSQADAFKELPFADVTLKHGNRYESLILTDDDLYYQSLSAKDAHAYTPFLLRSKNWTFRRMYSREWWKNAGSDGL